MSKRKVERETPDYAKMIERLIRRYGVRVGDADEVDLAEMLRIRGVFDEAIRTAVQGQRAQERSWAEIARGLGTTRQAAQMRYGSPAQHRSA